MGDWFYDPPQRFLGYGAAMGEALTYKFDNSVVQACTAIGTVYIITHILYVAMDAMAILAVVDVVLFQLAASAIIPTAINRFLCNQAADFSYDIDIIPGMVRDWIPVLIGVLVLPVYFSLLDPLITDMVEVINEHVENIVQ